VEFETNRYSVPTSCVGKLVDILAHPEHIEIWLPGQRIATHKRCFGRLQMIRNPLHAEKQLDRSPKFKKELVQTMVMRMDDAYKLFIERQETDADQAAVAQAIYQLMRRNSRAMVLSAVRELNGMGCAKLKALMSRLDVPEAESPPEVWPKNVRLLDLTYEERKLSDYDPDPDTV
jgi:hypothetical protein